MRNIIMTAAILAIITVSPAFAHCGKPHPDGKEKTTTSRPAPKPE